MKHPITFGVIVLLVALLGVLILTAACRPKKVLICTTATTIYNPNTGVWDATKPLTITICVPKEYTTDDAR